MVPRILTVLIVLAGLSITTQAQQAACAAAEIPVGVISANGDAFRGLAAEDFVGRIQKKPVSVKAITYDDSPRRTLIVVDTNKKLSSDTRKAETELVSTLLASARPEDTFGLMAAHGTGQNVRFTADRAAITQALNQFGEGKSNDPGVLDVVMAGIEWFVGEPKPGDAILLIAADTAGNHTANAKQVAKALADNHIRMFGLALGPVQTKSSVASSSMTSTTSQGLAWTKPIVGEGVYLTGDENFYPLTANSGGVVLGAMNGDSHRTYSMSDAHLVQELRVRARFIAKTIASYYRVQVEPLQLSHPEDWNLEISEEIRKHSQQMWVLYPHELRPCLETARSR
jgi:hypothetical protein